jgi:hypothetical protein
MLLFLHRMGIAMKYRWCFWQLSDKEGKNPKVPGHYFHASVFCLSTKSVQGLALSFECIHDVHGRHGFTPGVFRVRDSITDAIFQKHFEHTTCFFINQSTNTFHTTTTGQTTNGWFGNTLNIIAQDLAVTFGTALAELLSGRSMEQDSVSYGLQLLHCQ